MDISAVSDDLFAALAASTRREMIRQLAIRELPVSELAESFAMTISAVSQHLTVLKQAGLVTQRKAGRQRIYRLNAAPLRDVADWVNAYEPFWTQTLSALGDYLEENP